MQLIYLSPVPWSSFAQRPQKFAHWFHHVTQGDVLWIDPYPSRLPRLSDLVHERGNDIGIEAAEPWVKIVRPRSLPIEPLPFSGLINHRLFWSPLIQTAKDFAKQCKTLVVVGKPSELALRLTAAIPGSDVIYDAMDDFPAFFSGFSRIAMQQREKRVGAIAKTVMASSTLLVEKWRAQHRDVRFVANALDPQLMSTTPEVKSTGSGKVFGYIGTVGRWFDWEWVIQLANARPEDNVLIVGPLSHRHQGTLPDNVSIRPACSHREALALMLTFDVALIPFRQTPLTASVDPIKYYEYVAAGLPVMSTRFGEMCYRGDEPGVYLCDTDDQMQGVSEEALAYTPHRSFIDTFKAKNGWHARFDSANLPGIKDASQKR